MDIITSSSFFSFLLTCIIIESTPGPNMAYLTVLSLNDGRRAGYAATAGVALGLFVVGIAAALGVATLISNSVFAYQILRLLGVLYLFYLAWDTWKETDLRTINGTAMGFGHIKFFQRGLITNLLNPKAAVFYVAVLPNFISIDASAINQGITLTTVYVCIATFIHLLIVTLAGSARRFLYHEQKKKFVRRVMALALAGIAIWFAFTTNYTENL